MSHVQTVLHGKDRDKLFIFACMEQAFKHRLHPGEVLRLELQERRIAKKDFAKKICVRPALLYAFIRGEVDLTDELAKKLESALGIQYSTWMNLQRGYDFGYAPLNRGVPHVRTIAQQR